MPTKTRGMTSLEIAIIVAIVLVIAIAVGWYLYTTFAAAGQQTGLTATKATIYVTKDGNVYLYVTLVPQGAAQVAISSIEVAGVSIPCTSSNLVKAPGEYVIELSSVSVSVGQVLTGRIVLASGAISPFTATVVAADHVPSTENKLCSSQ